jgi:hypothetical protein
MQTLVVPKRQEKPMSSRIVSSAKQPLIDMPQCNYGIEKQFRAVCEQNVLLPT